MVGRWYCGGGLLLALMSLPTSAKASPQEVVGFGARSIAMGRAGVAVGRGADVVYANPALLAAESRMGLALGVMGAAPSLEAAGAAPLPDYPALRASTIGAVLPLPFGGVLKDRVALGVAFVTPFDVVVRGRVLYPERPQFLLADRMQSVAVLVGLGVDIGYGVRVGAGFAALAALTGSVTVKTDASGRIGTVVEDTLVASYAPIVGVSYDIDEQWRLGATFRGVLQARFNVTIVAENLGALNIPPLNISGVAQYDPWQLSAEVAHFAGPVRAALGLSYKHWSAYPGPQEATVRCGDAPEPDVSCAAAPVAPANYSPTAVPHIGVEGALPLADKITLELRAGYAFEPSPAPEQSGRGAMFDNHRSLFSGGWGVDIDGEQALRLDGFVQLQWLHDRSHQRRIADGAAADASVTTSGWMLAGGTSLGVAF